MPQSDPFPIVGVGASAGGIESFKKFVKAVPENSGMSYVLVQHLEPSHKSLLPEILSRLTIIPVHEVKDQQIIMPDHIYIIPENKVLAITDHQLSLKPRPKKGRNLPIDLFFISLAEVHKTMAVGVVLSGSAHDGTMGLKAIKEHGGITFAEDPRSAAWSGMPQSAVDAGVVDFVLQPSEIPLKLGKVYAAYPKIQVEEMEKLPKEEEDGYRQILSIIRSLTKVDFSYYKQPTIRRRIARRMAIRHSYSLPDYLHMLRKDIMEQEALFEDMLIKVSSFYRDPKTFQELETSVFPALFHGKPPEEPVRIWVAGCATGEEAYSLALSFHKVTGGLPVKEGINRKNLQIFASDLSEVSIEKARSGIYTKSDLQPLSDHQIKNYFIKVNNGFKAGNILRESIVFATHNFLQDPPFAKMDLISCRNVFIYMEPFLQNKALNVFHYALNNKGYLLLGQAETPNAANDLFLPVSNHEKIYMRKTGHRHLIVDTTDKVMKTKNRDVPVPLSPPPQPDYLQSADAILIAKHTPPGVIIDGQMDIVHIKGFVAPFLGSPPGKPTYNLVKMAHEGLGFELRNTIHKAKASGSPVTKDDIPYSFQGVRSRVSLEVIPLTDTIDQYYLILFKKADSMSRSQGKFRKFMANILTAPGKKLLQRNIQALTTELEESREDMRIISEDQAASNEELQTANEELLSSNEEMQSLNEELETSKEELQSTNEELIITNQELMEKQGELHHLLNYTEAIVATLRESLVVLDKDLRIRSANAAFYKKFEIDEKDVAGRLFFNIQNGQWGNDQLKALLYTILPEKTLLHDFEMRVELPLSGVRDLQLNAREILNGKKADRLILLAIEDVTERNVAVDKYKRSIEEFRKTNEQLDQFVHVASHDLQEPLRKILTFSDLMENKEKGDLSRETKTYLEKIRQSSSRMAALIRDLLEYARHANHKEDFEPTDLNECIGTVLPDLELVIEQKKAKLHVETIPKISAIPLQMNQLFYNLLSNALKFTKNDIPPEIHVLSRKLTPADVSLYPGLDSSAEHVEITVKDNGIGFDPEQKEKIFTIFQRLNKTADFPGTGIGLALVKRIIENHHGEIFARGENQKGAEIHMILPVQQPA